MTTGDSIPRPGDRWHLSASSVPRALAAEAITKWMLGKTADEVIANIGFVAAKVQQDAAEAKRWITKAQWNLPDGVLEATELGVIIHSHLEARLCGLPVLSIDGAIDKIQKERAERNRPPRLYHPDVVYDQVIPLVARLEEWLTQANPVPIEMEEVVLNPNDWVGGRLDLKVDIHGTRWLLDLKTSQKAVDWQGNPTKPYGDSHPLQLAILAHATHKATWEPRMTVGGGGRFYLAGDDELATATAPAPVDRGGILHLTPAHCHLHPVDIGDRTYAFARCVADAWRWLHLESKHVIGEAVTG